jgi:integrase
MLAECSFATNILTLESWSSFFIFIPDLFYSVVFFMPRKTFWYGGKKHDLTAKTTEELAVKVYQRKKDIDDGITRISKNMIVANWAMDYLETYRQSTVTPTTYKNLLTQYNNWIAPQIGKLRLVDVKATHCMKILNSMSGFSKSYITKVRQLLLNIFESAIDNELLYKNPARNLKIPVCTDGTHRALTVYERQVLLKVAETHEHGLWLLTMLYTGAGPGETARIQGQHIDFKGNRIFIDGTKTKTRKRWVPLPAPLLTAYKNMGIEPFKYVFTNKWGSPINKTNRKRMWESVRHAMNLEMGGSEFKGEIVGPSCVATDLTAYCLRHTYATDLEAAGVPINVAKRFLGHSNIKTTGNIYTHESESAFENARDLIDASVSHTPTKTPTILGGNRRIDGHIDGK